MKRLLSFFVGLMLVVFAHAVNAQGKEIHVDFYKNTFKANIDSAVLVNLPQPLTEQGFKESYHTISKTNYQPLVDSLLAYKTKYQLNDWLYYQLIRRVAQQISPKENNYGRYTFYKWFMLCRSGYDARLALSHQKLIFYIYNNEEIRDIPFFIVDGNSLYA
ncbi:MAG: hypothetical protein JWR05_1449 [Mucilaginibacter sp.]|nr:hypothetical protein [Mucilaginibacter sp.]